MHVALAGSDDPFVVGPRGEWGRLRARARRRLDRFAARWTEMQTPVPLTSAVLPSRWAADINGSGADVVNLHWLGKGMMSVGDIGRIRKPVVWTLHDMWAFCGAEHYTDEERYKDAYSHESRPASESGFDLNRWVWQRKRRAWRNKFHVVSPSHWLADCAKASTLMQDWPVTVIPNPINTDVWRPMPRSEARAILGLPQQPHLVAFGALEGEQDPRKGLDLLFAALAHLGDRDSAVELLVFGEHQPANVQDVAVPIHYLGRLDDDIALRNAYAAADAFVIPSRQDNLPNTGVEALACGVPLVAFNTGGIPDLVSHMQTGWLAEPLSPESLARGIEWILADSTRRRVMALRAREDAVIRFSYRGIGEAYKDVYERAVQTHDPAE